jgi:hypothetical protein
MWGETERTEKQTKETNRGIVTIGKVKKQNREHSPMKKEETDQATGIPRKEEQQE